MTAVAHVGVDYLDRLPAREVPAYAIAALEREANDTLRWMHLFLIPAEAFGGAKRRPIWNHLRNTAAWQLGEGTSVERRTPEQIAIEQELIREVEEEIARDFPIYGDPNRLNDYYAQNGAWARGRAA